MNTDQAQGHAQGHARRAGRGRRTGRLHGVFPVLIAFWVLAIAAVFTVTTCLKLAGPESLQIPGAQPARAE